MSLVPVMDCECDAATQGERERLTAELREILSRDEAEAAPPGTTRRGSTPATAGVGSWLIRSDAFLFSGSGPWTRLTDWGTAALTELLSVCVQNRSHLGPGIGRWLRDHLVPVLFPGTSDAGSPHWELVRLLLLTLLETTAAPADTEPPSAPAAATVA